MDDGKNLFKKQRGDRGAEAFDFLMEPLGDPLLEVERKEMLAEYIQAAKALIERSFTDDMKKDWTEGSIDAALRLCQRSGGLVVSDDGARLFAFFRYWPHRVKLIQQMSWGDLEKLDLSRGPLVHVVAFICPENGLRVFRSLIRQLNPFGVTAHRYDKRGERFAVKKHRACDPEQLRKELIVARLNNGQLRRQQEQEQVKVAI